MPDIYTCCCGLADLQYGCMIIGFTSLVVDLVTCTLRIYDSFTYVENNTKKINKTAHIAVQVASICALILLLCVDAGLLYGAIKKKKNLLPTWVAVKCIQIFFILITYFHFHHMHDQRALFEFFFQFGYICLTVYCCFVVCSFYRMLLYPNVVEVYAVRYYVSPEQQPRDPSLREIEPQEGPSRSK